MPSFLINETLPVPKQNTMLLLPGRTHIFPVYSSESKYQDKSLAVLCEPNDRATKLYVFDTPDFVEDEEVNTRRDLFTALCVEKNLLRRVLHKEIYQVVIIFEDESTVQPFTVKHFCDIGPDTYAYVGSDIENVNSYLENYRR